MTSWWGAKLFVCILFITYCCTVTFSQIPMDCCLSVRNQRVNRQIVVNYYRQIRGRGCSIDAMVLTTRRDKNLCVPADAPWIQDVVKQVVALKKYCKKLQYKGRNCYKVNQN
ncbi:C-C motif chemokine 19-like [Spinachia spinachia]